MKQLKKIGFYSAFILPLLLISGFYMGGIHMLLIHTFVFLLVPFLDFIFSRDKYNIPKNEISKVTKERFYKWVLYTWVYVQMALLFWTFYIVATHSLHALEWVLLLTGTALITGGIGITVAHELGHKKSYLDHLYAKALLMTVCYMHFLIEHNRGHHVRVATPEDPATSRKGESFYSFWWRSVKDGYLSAVAIEESRLKRKDIPIRSLSNQIIQFAIVPLTFVAFATSLFSIFAERVVWEVPLFFFIQSFLAFSLLEIVNYIEHYGMERKVLPNGKYEKVTHLHSWNACHTVSNFLLFQLQRHSDHHAYAAKPYQVLNHYDESPQLPTGYSAMLILALFPPLWFRVMNPKLDTWKLRQLNAA